MAVCQKETVEDLVWLAAISPDDGWGLLEHYFDSS